MATAARASSLPPSAPHSKARRPQGSPQGLLTAAALMFQMQRKRQELTGSNKLRLHRRSLRRQGKRLPSRSRSRSLSLAMAHQAAAARAVPRPCPQGTGRKALGPVSSPSPRRWTSWCWTRSERRRQRAREAWPTAIRTLQRRAVRMLLLRRPPCLLPSPQRTSTRYRRPLQRPRLRPRRHAMLHSGRGGRAAACGRQQVQLLAAALAALASAAAQKLALARALQLPVALRPVYRVAAHARPRQLLLLEA